MKEFFTLVLMIVLQAKAWGATKVPITELNYQANEAAATCDMVRAKDHVVNYYLDKIPYHNRDLEKAIASKKQKRIDKVMNEVEDTVTLLAAMAEPNWHVRDITVAMVWELPNKFPKLSNEEVVQGLQLFLAGRPERQTTPDRLQLLGIDELYIDYSLNRLVLKLKYSTLEFCSQTASVLSVGDWIFTK
jgi:hypothetical protein